MGLESINGVKMYGDGDDKPYEAEAAYYLNFHIISALDSLDHLTNPSNDDGAWENRCQYYHYYSDHLLFSMGQIANRFLIVDESNIKGNEKKRKQVLARNKQNGKNRANFEFSEESFPILSEKHARNVIEHIDEYNRFIIDENHGVGGFNLIDEKEDEKLIMDLRTKRATHPYTLDLLAGKLLVRYKRRNIDVELEKLRAELLALQKNVKWLMEMIRKPNDIVNYKLLPEGVTFR